MQNNLRKVIPYTLGLCLLAGGIAGVSTAKDLETQTYQKTERNSDIILNESSIIENTDAIESTAYVVTGTTKTGTQTEFGRTIAVDPDVIPLRKNVYIPQLDSHSNVFEVFLRELREDKMYDLHDFFQNNRERLTGYFRTEDTGPAIQGMIMDLYMGQGNYEIAKQFGRRNFNIYIVNDDLISE